MRKAGCQRMRLQRLERLVADRRGRGGAILRIERDDENAVAAVGLQRFDALADRRLPVAHRPIDDDVEAEIAQQQAPSFSLCERVIVFSGPSSRSLFQIAS